MTARSGPRGLVGPARPTVVARCRWCATRVLSDDPASATCEPCGKLRRTLPRCRCGDVSMPDPSCPACLGSGLVGQIDRNGTEVDAVCVATKCATAPCHKCVVGDMLGVRGQERDARNGSPFVRPSDRWKGDVPWLVCDVCFKGKAALTRVDESCRLTIDCGGTLSWLGERLPVLR